MPPDLWGFLWLRQGLWINDQHSFLGFGAHYLDLLSDDRMFAHEHFQGFRLVQPVNDCDGL